MMQLDQKLSESPLFEELLRDRLLRYLHALRVPPREGLEMALAVMEGQDAELSNEATLRKCLEDLKRLLEEGGFAKLPDWRSGRAFSSVPPYNRGTMPPAPIASATRLRLVRLWQRIKGGSFER